MSKWSFPTFHYYPLKLAKESKRVQNKYKNADEVPKSIARKKLSRLLEEIRNLENKTEVIIAYGKKLNKLDVNILATEFPYENEDQITIKKISVILTDRYSRLVGRRFWIHFQRLLLDKEIINILRYAFENEDESYLSLAPSIREKYNDIFKSKKVLGQLAYQIGNEKAPIEELFIKWKVDNDSKLARVLWLLIMQLFINVKWFLDVQGIRTISSFLERLPLEKYKELIKKYLDSFDMSDYDEILLRQAIEKLQDPRNDTRKWGGISQKTIEKVKQYLFRAELHEFLDYDRFEFWEKYLNKIDKLRVIEDPPIAAMYFGDFVAVEFANTGNAAYFYETDGFDKQLAPKLISYVWESSLKDREAPYFINKLNHAGAWDSRFDEYMSRYLVGHYWYKH